MCCAPGVKRGGLMRNTCFNGLSHTVLHLFICYARNRNCHWRCFLAYPCRAPGGLSSYGSAFRYFRWKQTVVSLLFHTSNFGCKCLKNIYTFSHPKKKSEKKNLKKKKKFILEIFYFWKKKIFFEIFFPYFCCRNNSGHQNCLPKFFSIFGRNLTFSRDQNHLLAFKGLQLGPFYTLNPRNTMSVTSNIGLFLLPEQLWTPKILIKIFLHFWSRTSETWLLVGTKTTC